MPARVPSRPEPGRAAPPAFVPMAATLVDGPFDHPDWVFEPKFDGLRVQARFDGRALTLLSRNDIPQEGLFPDVAGALRAALDRPAVFDGEVVCFDADGRTSFRALQQRFHLTDPAEIAARAAKYPAAVFLFDLLWLDGRDLTGEPLSARKDALRTAVRWSERVRWTEYRAGAGRELFEAACRNGEEGVIGKLLTGRYVGRRDPAWVKVKCLGRQEFVIGGFTDPQRSRVGLGALLVGYYEGDALTFAGKVGTGYTRETLLALRERLGRLERGTSPFESGDPPAGPGVHWVRPALVAEVAFAEWTQNGLLRQPRFEGLRTDKKPKDCRRERPTPSETDVAEATMPAKSKKPAALGEYEAKRDFRETPEPGPEPAEPHKQPIFVVQEHHATRLHYDFRLEADGVLKSWAVTNEPSLDPAVKRLAVRVEDHPVAYATFEGTIPAGHYGAGVVSIWDRGTFENLDPAHDIADGLDAGKLSFALHGEKLNGRFSLVRMRGRGGKKEQWLLIKGRDEHARSDAAAAKPAKKPAAKTAAPARKAGGTPGEPPPAEVVVTHPDKVLFPAEGYTKADVAAYYRTVADRLLPFLKDRPVTLERLPDGVGGGKPHFWQKNTPASYPGWIPRVRFDTETGKPVEYVLVNDVTTLLYLVNQGALTFHPWLSRIGSPDRPDFVLFDLDPGQAAFAGVVAVAKALHATLKAGGHEAVVKTSGKTGLHVLVPWDGGDFDAARGWALEVAERVAGELPDTATTDIRKAKRGGRVYIDVLQNARGHHAVPPYVLRAVPGATGSTPLRWAELTADLDPTRFTLKTVPARLARQTTDPLAALAKAM